MKKTIGLLFTILPILIQTSCLAAEYAFSYGSVLTYYDSDGSSNGTQFFAPFGLSGKYDRFSFDLLTAGEYTKGEASGETEEIMAFTDTKAGLSYTLKNGLPVNAVFFLDMNLPTGKKNLSLSEAAIFSDADLFPLKPYGEGLNLNPGVAIAKSLNNWTVGVGISYNFRGEYDFHKAFKDYDPGDIILLTVETSYTGSETWSADFFGEFGTFGKDKADGSEIYQQADFLRLGGTAAYKTRDWETSAGLEMTLRVGIINDEEVKTVQNGQIFTEKDNVTGDEYIVFVSHKRFLSDVTTAAAFFEIMHLEENDYGKSSALYFGARNKFTIGASAVKSLSAYLEGEVFGRIFYIDADESYLHPKDVAFTGITLGITITRYF